MGQGKRLGIVADLPSSLPPTPLNIDPTLLQRAAAEAAGTQQYPAGALYVVATPIGNLADLTLRAIHVLSLVDAVACEDTRVSAGLLRHLGLDKPLIALHQHNEARGRAARAAAAGAGRTRGLCQRCRHAGRVRPRRGAGGAGGRGRAPRAAVPGASSALAALSVAGDARGSGFAFVGFLPRHAARERHAALQACLAAPQAQVLFEAPHRIAALADVAGRCCAGSAA